MAASPLSRVFGTRVPPAIKGDIERINSLPSGPLKKAISDLEKIAFSRVPTTPDRVQAAVVEIATDAGLTEDDGRILLRLYAALVSLVTTSPSEAKLKESLIGSGLSEDRAAVFAHSLYAHKPDIEAELGPSLGERYGPTVTRVFWRIDQPVAGTEPFIRSPLAVITFVLDTATDTYDERFEVDLVSLDLILDELGTVRRELAKLASKAK
jgi:hypothetical protein